MRITIDTQQDSKEQIRKAIELLRSMVEGTDASSGSGFQDMFGNSSPSSEPSSGGVFDMFNSTPVQEPQSSQSVQEKPYKPKGPTVMGFELYE